MRTRRSRRWAIGRTSSAIRSSLKERARQLLHFLVALASRFGFSLVLLDVRAIGAHVRFEAPNRVAVAHNSRPIVGRFSRFQVGSESLELGPVLLHVSLVVLDV